MSEANGREDGTQALTGAAPGEMLSVPINADTGPVRDAYDVAMGGIDFELCRGCEDAIVMTGTFCVDCQRIHDELSWRYEMRGVRPFAEMPREDNGMTIFTEGNEYPRGNFQYDERGSNLSVMAAAAGLFLTVFCLVGWYGLRLATAVGIWLAQ